MSGWYEFRYLLNDGYTDVARSYPLTVSRTSAAIQGAPVTAPMLQTTLSEANIVVSATNQFPLKPTLRFCGSQSCSSGGN